jgi:hypothetical protein
VRRQLLVIAMVVGAVPLLAGCDLLMGTGSYNGYDDDLGEELATYATGRATLEIDGRTIVLDQLGAGPHLISGFGADVYWYNEDGWGLRLNAYDGDMMMSGTDITIDRVQTTYWSANGFDDCVVEVDKADETGVKGSATCDGLRWSDQLRGSRGWSGGPSRVEGEPAFDSTITFEARPAPGSQASPAPTPSPSPS